MRSPRCRSSLAAVAVAFALVAPPVAAADRLVPLVRVGPWSAVSELVGYGSRLWFVNSEKFVDHNSADVWSYDPRAGLARYERHLFSQDAGDPVVAEGLLYWPFEDARFSTRRGEYAVTNGRDWQWRVLPDGNAFHVHAMTARGGSLFAGTGAWRAGLQRSDDGGRTWRVIYDRASPPDLVSRITALGVVDDTVYAALTARGEPGAKLLRLDGDDLRPVDGWPSGASVRAPRGHRGWLYAVNVDAHGSAVWRTNGRAVERVRALDRVDVRAFAGAEDTLWAISARDGAGELWTSADGTSWRVVQRFDDAEPVDVTVYAGQVYVGTIGPAKQGTLWGPAAAARVEPDIAPPHALPAPPPSLRPDDVPSALETLDRALASADTFANRPRALLDALLPLAQTRDPDVGEKLARRLDARVPDVAMRAFGSVPVSARTYARWYLLWAIGLNGHGRVPPAWITARWTERPNEAEKYFDLPPAAAWTAAEIGQSDPETLAALVSRLGVHGDPRWLTGDVVGALTTLSGERFAYDIDAWRRWSERRRTGGSSTTMTGADDDMVTVPAGELAMGSDRGEPAERPVHRVWVSTFMLDRREVTNAAFAEFVRQTGYVTDAERARAGWDWNGEWHEVRGADWRHPHGPRSSIAGLDRHPVVQVSWNDAARYCAWRGARLPTEAEWERAARDDGTRAYPWGDAPPHERSRYRASLGSDACCRADAGDGFRFTAPVGTFPLGRSPLGIDDLAGNVWEWVEDGFDPDYYGRSPSTDPVNREPGAKKVIRGGGWGNDAAGLRSTLRHANPPDIGLSMVGVRCARSR